MNCSFEIMSQEHEKDVIDILNYYAENTTYAYPEEKLPYHFYSKLLEAVKEYPAFVIKSAAETAGFCMLKPYSPNPVFRKTAEISYFIKKEYTGKGIGSQALLKLEETAGEKGIKIILASISSENETSINFHLRKGFYQCGLFKNVGTKFNRSFDIIWMEKNL